VREPRRAQRPRRLFPGSRVAWQDRIRRAQAALSRLATVVGSGRRYRQWSKLIAGAPLARRYADQGRQTGFGQVQSGVIRHAHDRSWTISSLEGAAWSSDYIAEMTAFPGSAHDDFVDATVQALSHLRDTP